jgi:hypothetical protein
MEKVTKLPLEVVVFLQTKYRTVKEESSTAQDTLSFAYCVGQLALLQEIPEKYDSR